jgi:hypothetical protein
VRRGLWLITFWLAREEIRVLLSCIVGEINVLSLVKYDSKMAIVLLLMDVVIVSVSGKRSYLLAHL